MAHEEESVLLLVDIQPNFLKIIPDAEQMIQRAIFLLEAAKVFQIPILVTEQYAQRMGGTDERIKALLPPDVKPVNKMAFSACGSEEFLAQLEGCGRHQIVIAGAETHICINQTAHDLLEAGYEVILACDAITGRGASAKEVAFRRMVEAGAIEAHSESIAYEWACTADRSEFKALLDVVKKHPI